MIRTLSELVTAAKACGNNPSVIGGVEHYTMVIDLDKKQLRLEPTTSAEYVDMEMQRSARK